MGLCSQVFGLAKQLLERELLRKRPQIGVAVLVRDSASRLLMIQRKGSHGSGTWSVPGGAVEAGETIAEAMQRELFEETGIRASPCVLSSSWGDLREPFGAWTFTEMGVEGGTWLTLYGVVDLADENVTVWPERGKIQEVRWVHGYGQWPGELFAPFKQALKQGLNPFTADDSTSGTINAGTGVINIGTSATARSITLGVGAPEQGSTSGVRRS